MLQQEIIPEAARLEELAYAMRNIIKLAPMYPQLLNLPTNDWKSDVQFIRFLGLIQEATIIENNHDLWSMIAHVINNSP